MEKRLNNENYAVYKMIATVEELDGKRVLMYGIEGRNKDERISVSSLNDDKERIRPLVEMLNDGGFELCHLKDAVNDFLYETYGICVK